MDRRIALGLFVLVFAIYGASKVKIQTDSIWSIPTAASLLHEGNCDLDEFRPTFTSFTHSGVLERGDHAYYAYPMGVVIAALPFLIIADAITGAVDLGGPARRWHDAFHATGTIDLGFYNRTEQLIASFYVGVATAVVFFTARRKASLRGSIAVALLFALGTTAYSTASRVLWAHSVSVLAIAVVVWLLTRPNPTARSMLVLGLTVAAAYVCRPTNALTVLAVTVLVIARYRKFLPAYLGGAVLIAVPFCAWSLGLFGSVLPPYYTQHMVSQVDGRAFVGQLLSPSRGLLVFSPILIVSLAHAVQQLRRRTLTAPEVTFLAIVVAHWVMISTFHVWWAGHSVGPRFFTDVLPYFTWFLIDPVAAVVDTPRARPIMTCLVALAAVISIAIHTRGATSPAVHHWNDGPPNVDAAPERAWDWSDPQFLR